METINKIELKGTVGAVHRTDISGHGYASFSLKTERVVKPSDGGEAYVETEWHSCEAWDDKDKDNDLTKVVKGEPLHIIGRLRYQSYVNSDGLDRAMPIVWVKQILKD